jgi:hypothetical protein
LFAVISTLTHELYCCLCKCYCVSYVRDVISFLLLPFRTLNENISENSAVPQMCWLQPPPPLFSET